MEASGAMPQDLERRGGITPVANQRGHPRPACLHQKKIADGSRCFGRMIRRAYSTTFHSDTWLVCDGATLADPVRVRHRRDYRARPRIGAGYVRMAFDGAAPVHPRPPPFYFGKPPDTGGSAGSYSRSMNSDNPNPSDRSRPTEPPRKLAPATPSPDPNPFLEPNQPRRPSKSAPQEDPSPDVNPPARSPKQENS